MLQELLVKEGRSYFDRLRAIYSTKVDSLSATFLLNHIAIAEI